MQAGNEPMATYVSDAYCRDAIPKQAPLRDISGFAKSLEAGDFIERLPWGDYAHLDIHVRPQYVEAYQERLKTGEKKLEGAGWTHLQKPKDLIKARWQLLLMLAGAFADYWMLKVLLFCFALAEIAAYIKFGEFSYLILVVIGLHFFSATPSPGF